MTINVKLDTGRLDQLAAGLNIGVERVMEEIALRIEDRAKQLCVWDTGALRSSIYTVTRHKDGYSKASTDAKDANPIVITYPLPTPTGKTIAIVGPCTEYGAYVEFGTSRKGARPFMSPALQTVAMLLNSGEIFKGLFR